MNQLKRCPLCEKLPKFDEETEQEVIIECKSCGLSLWVGHNDIELKPTMKNLAIERWNRRAK